MPRVLVVEDDLEIAEPLVRTLQSEGYTVAHVDNGSTALDLIAQTNPDAVVLDLGLPTIDGIDVCRTLRDRGDDVPILILTARTSELDLVVGLDAGADDYLQKPFRSSELLARLRALLRRSAGISGPVLTSGNLFVDTQGRLCRVGNDIVALTPTEFDLLELLMRNAGQLITRQRILRDIWDTDWSGSTKSLDMHMSSMRRKIGEHGDRIATIRGHGYRFDEV